MPSFYESGTQNRISPSVNYVSDPGLKGFMGATPQEAQQMQLMSAQAGAVHDPLEAAKLQNQLGQQTLANQAGRFNSIYGLLSGQLNGGGGLARSAANLNPMANIGTGPVLNDAQVQQQVNQSRSATDQSVQGQQARTSASLAGRGFGSNSPLAMALNQATANQGLATNVGNETNTRLNAAQMNAQHMLGAQQAQAGNVNQYNQNLIENAKPYWQRQNALISALGGLI